MSMPQPDPTAVPAGFQPISMGGAFIAHNGPFYLLHEGEVVKLGFRVEPRHCNPAGICHGGMVASFADMLLPATIHRKGALQAPSGIAAGPADHVRGHFLPTVNLQIDYMAPAKLGDWVEGEAQVLKATVGMVFAQGLITSGGTLAARCSGVFKIGPLFADLNSPRRPKP
jgi:uncharacterized protein (TIGR00369 family)